MSMTIDEQIEILKAIKAGKTVEYLSDGSSHWLFMHPGHSCNFESFIYRVEKVPQTRTLWVNCYENNCFDYSSKRYAMEAATADILARKKITFTFVPGEFDE